MLLNVANLQNYYRLGYNVLLEGEAGVGKTAVISQVFEGLNWKYFSASTLDPWVDFVGIPRHVKDEKLGDVIDLVRPRFIVEDNVEAIFLDELNRAPDKVLNAVMELIQFKSINGRKLHNLKVIWAAINPADDQGDYTVSHLDKALRDRFHVQIQVPYKLDENYFKTKYPQTADAFIAWWCDLPTAVQKTVSPRRLDYAAAAHENGCLLSDFLPAESNIGKLKKAIKAIPFQEQLSELLSKNDATSAGNFLAEINHATKLLLLINQKDPTAVQFYKKFGAVLPKELVNALAPQISAFESGARITTFNELLPVLNGKAGEVAITQEINSVAFAYSNETLHDAVKREVASPSIGLRKLVNHMTLVMSRAPEPVLRAAMFKPGTCERSNFAALALFIADADKTFALFSREDRKKINSHTYALKCAASKWM